MAYCDDDDLEYLPEVIINYYFVDDNKEPVSFSVLPIIWTTSQAMQSGEKLVYMRGDTDMGLRRFFKQVCAWKFDLSGVKPEISVLSKDNNWIKLQKPRKSCEQIMRTASITVNFLHLLKKSPELTGEVLWDKLSQTFSSYDNRPSVNDLVDHKALIEEAVKQDESLTKSKYLVTFLEDMLQNKRITDETALVKETRKFIVDDNDSSEEEDSSSEEEDSCSGEEDGSCEQEGSCKDEEVGDSVCCICDNGGTLLLCEGICMRSFHPTQKAAEKAADTPKSQCVSLGFSKKEVKGMPIFKCKNCLYQRHQCFSCGQLGSSDKSLGAEVFQCVNATCGYFYHPRCVAKLLNLDSEAAVEELQGRILAGDSLFTCPLHKCRVCKQPEDKTVHELQMAVCRRCPKAYHRKCLPRNIAFKDNKKEGIIQRAWEKLLVDRILIYCLKHEICNDLKTPERNHIKFPDDEKRKEQSSAVALKKDNVASKKKKPPVRATCPTGTTIQSKKRTTEDHHLDKRNGGKFSKPRGPDTMGELPNEMCNDLMTPVRNHVKFPNDDLREKQSSAIALKKAEVVSEKKKPPVGKTCPTGTAIQSKRTIEDCHLEQMNDGKFSKPRGPDNTRELPNEMGNVSRTPERNHIKFPDDAKPEEQSSPIVLKRDNVVSKKRKPSVVEICQAGTAIESKKRTVEDSHLDKRDDREFSKLKGPDSTRKLPNEKKSRLTQVDGSSRAAEQMISLGDQLYEFYSQKLDSEKPSTSDKLEGKLTKTSRHVLKKVDSQLDSDSEQRILDLMTEASSEISLPDVIKKYGKVTSRAYKMDSNKSIMRGKVEHFCEAIRAGVRKLDEGSSIEDAKAICEPKVLKLVDNWKDKLRVYLAPFLLGMCYTSFGRHFIKVDKLQEIVDKIHYYFKSGDTIVDFCCGANDFSCLMKEKLEQMNKHCSYKNYDLHPAKNDFNLEVRDWFTVEPGELPSGSQLIMGLNPPFGVKARLANKFIDHALEFKPKLLILVAPPETERLEKKKTPYNLIWEDNQILSGKSFYLPGSVDTNDKQIEDWNIVPPNLYLWSHPDWTNKHKAIAEKVGQLSGEREDNASSKWKHESPSDNHDNGNVVGMEVDHGPLLNHPPEGQKGKVTSRQADDSPGNKQASDTPETRGRGNQDQRKTVDRKDRSSPNNHEGRKNANDTPGISSRSQGLSQQRNRGREHIENLLEHHRHSSSPSESRHRGPHPFSGSPSDQNSSRHQQSPINNRRGAYQNQASRQLVVSYPQSNYGPRNSAEWAFGSTAEEVAVGSSQQHQSTSGRRVAYGEPSSRPQHPYVANRLIDPSAFWRTSPQMRPNAGGNFNGHQAPSRKEHTGGPMIGCSKGRTNSYHHQGAYGARSRR